MGNVTDAWLCTLCNKVVLWHDAAFEYREAGIAAMPRAFSRTMTSPKQLYEMTRGH
jgi:hypothetical protein